MNHPIRILVVDDHALFRHGLVGLLSEMPEFEVAGEAGDGQEALEVVARARPDIVLLDINMPGLDGIDTLKALQQIHPAGRVLMLTVSQEEEDLVAAIMAGASGYLLKNAEIETLRKTLLQVAAGNSVLSPEMTAKLLRVIKHSTSDQTYAGLSGREREVLRCMARGMTTAHIAAELYISENTVKTHVRHILEKMGVANRAEAVARATQLGLI